ncbi:MAG: flagellar protein FlgN [Pseudomonadota bacterium]
MKINPTLSDQLATLQQQLAELLPLLQAERAALVDNDLEQLTRHVELKRNLLMAIHGASQQLDPDSVRDRIAAAPEPEQSQLAAAHSSLKALAAEVREYNRVNGKIVARSQQSVAELLQLTFDDRSEKIYGENGESRSLAAGASVAQA